MNNRNSKIICTVSFVGAFFALIACGDSKTTETIVAFFVFHKFTKEITL